MVNLSSTKGKLDPKKITFIAKALTTRELSLYQRLLLRKREEEKVYVSCTIDVPEVFAERLAKLFPQKDLVFLKDMSLLSGIKIQVGDFIFDASFSAFLEEMSRQLRDPAAAGRREHEVN